MRKRGLSPEQGDEAGPSKMAKVPTSECLVCCEQFPASSTFTSTCSHSFCQVCLQNFFRDSLQEAKFPAKCCGRPIPETAHQYLSADLVDNLRRKKTEYAIPMAKRVFCSGCGSVLLPTKVDDKTMTGYCDECESVTCTRCKNFEHEGPCRKPSEQKDVAELMKLSREESWVICYKCGHTIEKAEEDCDHITQVSLHPPSTKGENETNSHSPPTSCVCGAQFCYQCGTKWKTCNCFHPEFTLTGRINRNFRRTHLQGSPVPEDENQDMEHANRQGQNAGANQTREHRLGPLAAAQIVHETELHLALAAPQPPPLFPKRDWNCKHQNRRKNHRNGPYNCADCPNIQPSFIWECRDCKLLLCGRCVKLYDGWDFWEEQPQGRAKGGNENPGINGGVSGGFQKKKKKNPREGRKGRGQWRKDAKDVLEGNVAK